MLIKACGLCRGSGKVFVKFTAKEVPAGHSIDIESSTDGGMVIPSAMYELSDAATATRTFVGVFPDLSHGRCASTLYEVDEESTRLATWSYSFDFAAAKWKSRLNYRINKSLCKEIRDADHLGLRNEATLDVWECIDDNSDSPDSPKTVIRGAVHEPYYADSDVSVSCLGEDLHEVGSEVIYLSNSIVPIDPSSDESCREVQFSLRVPATSQRLIFVMTDRTHPALSSFEVIDSPLFDEIRNNTASVMMTADKDPAYEGWFQARVTSPANLAKQSAASFEIMPTFSIIVPLYKTPLDLFEEMVESVCEQSYGKWELMLVNASPEDAELCNAVDAASCKDARIRVITLENNLGISGNTNRGIEASTGDFVCFFDHDDLLEPDILFEYAKAVNDYEDTDVIYCDEDKVTSEGVHVQPFFKPDFNIDLLRSTNYICHMLAIRKALLDRLEPNTSEFDGAQDHNLTLQAVERARHVHHVPKVLYHWRITKGSTAQSRDNKSYATLAGINAVQNHLNRLGLSATVSEGSVPFTYRVVYDVPKEHPLVSIIIPSKDYSDVLDACIQSIVHKSTYDNYEIVIVENNSTEPETFAYYDHIQEAFPTIVRVEYWPAEFNFSKLMNFGAQKAMGDYLLLLNNDTEVITPNWIEVLVGLCSRKDVGAAGVRLYYKDDTVQHAGVAVTGACAGHIEKDLPRGDGGYFSLRDRQQDLSAVTAACMMTRRDAFESVGGFTEELTVAFNDIDFCLKIREKDLLVVYTPEVELYHYESLSRGYENSVSKQIRFKREISYMNYRWAEYYVVGDPYQNRNITRAEPYCYYYHL